LRTKKVSPQKGCLSNRKNKKFIRQLKSASQKHSGLFKWAAESPGKAQKKPARPRKAEARRKRKAAYAI